MESEARHAQVTPEEAARSLAEIRSTQAQAIRAHPWFPNWYPMGVGGVITGIQVITEPGTPVPIMAGVGVLLAAALGALIAVYAKGSRVRAHRSLMTLGAGLTYAGWLVTSVAVNGALTIALLSADIPYARAGGALGMTVFWALTGPPLAQWITGRMAAKIEQGV